MEYIVNCKEDVQGRAKKEILGEKEVTPGGCKDRPYIYMGLKTNVSPAEGEFLFELDPEPLEECVTAMGGIPLFVRAIRSLDIPGSVRRNLQLKQRQKQRQRR